jgi:hypothetical protein
MPKKKPGKKKSGKKKPVSRKKANRRTKPVPRRLSTHPKSPSGGLSAQIHQGAGPEIASQEE